MLSAKHLKYFPKDEGAEIAFVGRSNSGKSSAINRTCGLKKLAHVSKTPGRTQMINFFTIQEDWRLVDLPGYGYARVPLAVKQHWQKLMTTYLTKRVSLKALILIMDIRHPLTEYDITLLDWAGNNQIAVHILLTKADKLKRGTRQNTLFAVQTKLQDYTMPLSIQVFSAKSGEGVEEARDKLSELLSA